MIGLTIGRYEIVGELGAGGMGIVYRAHDPVLQRDVALKVLAPHLAADAQAREDFLSEARAAAKLTHPNIVTVYEAGTDNGQVFIAMELVEGGDLRDELHRSSRLSPERACSIVKDVAHALDHSHNQPQPVIHRDIKPANILMTRDGRPTVADFGIAKVQGDIGRTGTGLLKGTLAYMAPELFEGVKPNPKTDQWSLGVLAYELLSGVHPFGDAKNSTDDQLSVIMRIAKANPPKLLVGTDAGKIETALDRTVRQVLSRDSAQRFETATVFADTLQRIISPGVIQKFPRWAVLLIATLVIAVVALASVPGILRDPGPNDAFKAAKSSADMILLQLTKGEVKSKIADPNFQTTFAPQFESLQSNAEAMKRNARDDSEVAQGSYYASIRHTYLAMHQLGLGEETEARRSITLACDEASNAISKGLAGIFRPTLKQWLSDARSFAKQNEFDVTSPEWQRLSDIESGL